MDAPAVAIPIPVQPIDPQQPAPGTGVPTQSKSAAVDFAAALEEQIGLAVVTTTGVAALIAPAREAGETEPKSDAAESVDAATSDGLLALIAAQLPPPFAQPNALPATATPAAHRAPAPTIEGASDRERQPLRAAGDGRSPAPGALPPLDLHASDERAKAAGREHERLATALPAALDLSAVAPSGLPHASPASPVPAAVHDAPAHDARLAERVGTSAWNDGLAQQVTLMVRDGEHTARLRLDPPDLGPLEVRVTMTSSDESVAHAQFISPHASVRDAVEAALPQLRAVLADSGITLGQASVGEGYVRDDRRDAQPGAGEARGDGGSDEIAPVAAPRIVARNGLVDTFA